MAIVAVVGGQWGDEGKGKVVDMLGGQCRVVARYNGGNNAGHTVVNEHGKFFMHLVPSGIFNPDSICIVGNGTVINPRALLEELAGLQKVGTPLARLLISDRAQIIMPYHLQLDCLEEAARGSSSIGTTGRGIGPAYADKHARLGIRAGDLVNAEILREKLAFTLQLKNRLLVDLYKSDPFNLDEVYDEYCRYAQSLAPYVGDALTAMRQSIAAGDNVLLEGAQGTMLDIDFGTYPYVTSSTTIAAGGFAGAGVPLGHPVRGVGVFKAYTSRVGGGPFPTELDDEVGQHIRDVGHEYGTTTGRPRRCGWLDAVVSRYSVEVNGLSAIALTRLDVLDDLPMLRVCTAYRLGDQELTSVPASVEALARCEPVYEDLPGWQAPTGSCRQFDELPRQAQQYVQRMEELLHCPVDVVSVGPGREQTIIRRALFA
ncbi:MAG: adenylosuccinate synthase [Chloroflexota bacterium]